MARIGSELTQRMIINQWVSFHDDLGILSSISQFKDLKNTPDFQKVKNVPVLGYVYVDHDAGISLKVEGLYLPEKVPESEIEKISRFIRDSVSLKFRFDVIRMLDFHILDDNERDHRSLPTSPDWLKFYESPELKAMRDCEAIDHLRAEGFFDDVSAIIVHSDTTGIHSDSSDTPKPEIVWVRLLEYSSQDRQFRGMLLNQPFHEIGIRKNDLISLKLHDFNNSSFLVVER